VQYTALPPGDYRFQVAAVNADGVWNEEGVSLAVLVQPFFWQTVSFQLMAGAFVLGLLVWGVHTLTARRHRLALEDLERRHALERERMRIASDLHDDVGSNLGSIALLSRDVERRAPGDGDFSEDLAEITRLAQETSESMRDIVWFVNPDEDTVEKMLLRMKDVASNLLGGIRFVFEASELAVDTRLSPQFKRQFFLIYKEALHNVRKHARAANVVIRLAGSRGRLQLEIEDDGMGFDPTNSARGHGLSSMRRRAEERRWHLELVSSPGGGTRIRLAAGWA
jgi:signal transduction histidine kinase